MPSRHEWVASHPKAAGAQAHPLGVFTNTQYKYTFPHTTFFTKKKKKKYKKKKTKKEKKKKTNNFFVEGFTFF